MKTETSAEKWFVTSSRCFMGFILALSWQSDGSLLAMMLISRVEHVGALLLSSQLADAPLQIAHLAPP